MEQRKVTVVIDADYFLADRLVDVVLTVYPKPLSVVLLRDTDEKIDITLDLNQLSEFKVKTVRLPTYTKANLSLALTYVASYIQTSDKLGLSGTAERLITESFETNGMLGGIISGFLKKTTDLFIFTDRDGVESEALPFLFGLPVKLFTSNDTIPNKPPLGTNTGKGFKGFEEFMKMASATGTGGFGGSSTFQPFGATGEDIQTQAQKVSSGCDTDDFLIDALKELREGSCEYKRINENSDCSSFSSESSPCYRDAVVSPPSKRESKIITHGM
jgi:hypothetical protein